MQNLSGIRRGRRHHTPRSRRSRRGLSTVQRISSPSLFCGSLNILVPGLACGYSDLRQALQKREPRIEPRVCKRISAIIRSLIERLAQSNMVINVIGFTIR
jgi:hypothetical protein